MALASQAPVAAPACGGVAIGGTSASSGCACRAQQLQPQPSPSLVASWQGLGSSEAEGGVEADPTGRYIRYPLLLGRGACKRVYKAFDLQEGIEVAWNKAELSGTHIDGEARERLFSEIRVLSALNHRNIITCYDWWHDAPSETVNFITELFTSGTLRQYRKRHSRHINDTAIKRWAFQILEGLLYLHAHSPPIIHRDLKVERLVHTGCTPAAGVSAASPSQSDADGQAGVSGQGFGRVIIRTRFLRQQEQGAARMQRCNTL